MDRMLPTVVVVEAQALAAIGTAVLTGQQQQAMRVLQRHTGGEMEVTERNVWYRIQSQATSREEEVVVVTDP